MPRNLPRRNQTDKNEPAELAIRNAMTEVEKVGADVELTEVGMLLESAFNKLADYIDAKK
ncbi:MAG TPA: hypothetical protein VN922_00935 [Bacteroidia bacterium]|nr:hypothetical protein [Bacteroidia bacterium]